MVALCAWTLERKASCRSSAASYSRTPLSVGGLGKTRDRQSDLDRSPNTLDSRSEVIQPPGQTAQKKQAKLLEKSWRAMALRAHL